MSLSSSLACLHPIWREALATYECYRRLGFVPEDIVLGRGSDGTTMLTLMSVHYACVLRTGDREADIAFKDLPDSEILAEWARVGELWNTASVPEMEEVFKGSLVFRRKVEFVHGLIRAGIDFPRSADA